MTNEEKIAELMKVSKMPMEEAIAYMKKSIAKSKMKKTSMRIMKTTKVRFK